MQVGSDVHEWVSSHLYRMTTWFDTDVLRTDDRRRLFLFVVGFVLGFFAWLLMLTISSVYVSYYTSIVMHDYIFGKGVKRDNDIRFVLVLDVILPVGFFVVVGLYLVTEGFGLIVNLVCAVAASFACAHLGDKGWLWYEPARDRRVFP